jgi:signal transduction histidine kinase
VVETVPTKGSTVLVENITVGLHDFRDMNAGRKHLGSKRERGWLMPTLVLGVIALITAFVVVMVLFYSDLEQIYEEGVGVYLFNWLLLGFVVIAFLFVGYLAVKEFASKKLKTDLVQQKINSQVLERRIKELEAVHELTTLVNSQMALHEVLDGICSKALKTFEAGQCSLFLYDPKLDKLCCVSVHGDQGDVIKDATVEIGKSVAGWVLKNARMLHLNREVGASKFDGSIKSDKDVSSSLCLPLLVKNEARGVLDVSLFDHQRKLSNSDAKLASIFAEHAAIAIDKAGLYEELEKHTNTVKKVVRELKASKDRSAKPETLCALGNLACGMAHEFGDILVGIESKIKALLDMTATAAIPEETREEALQLLRGTERLAAAGTQTAEHVAAFARTFQQGEEKAAEELDVNSLVQEAIALTAYEWRDVARQRGVQIEMETELGALLNPLGDPEEIKDVIASIIFSAVEALPQGGKIKIVTGMAGNRVQIKIIDSSAEMTEKIRSNDLEPLFTTKKDGGASGIGLSLARGIISKHSGEIALDSQPGKGTTATITLPAPENKEAGVKREIEVVAPSAV